MSAWEPNFSWITDEIAVGGSFPADRAESLARDHGIKAVVDLRGEDKDDEHILRRHGITLLHLPTVDMCGVDATNLDVGVRFVGERLALGERVLVHCEHGIGRSAALALCILVQRGHAPLEALLLMKERRTLISPSADQFACWTAWLERHRRSNAVDWTIPSYHEFGVIAYRHIAAQRRG